MELPDGDFVDLDWIGCAEDETPLVLLLHGLEGSSDSHYARGLLASFERRGWLAAVVHFRGRSGTPNRLARIYHSGETGDFGHVVGEMTKRHPARPRFAVGVSLGGNVLLKWLGENGAGAPLDGAVAISVPFDLARCADRLERGCSRLYRRMLVHDLHRSVRRKFEGWPSSPIDLGRLSEWRTFRQFDEHVTAPLHGFRGADDYYRKASSGPYVARIRVPTLIVQAMNDPFMPPGVVPPLSPAVRLEATRCGGHAGFVSGAIPGRPRYWLDERVPAFVEEVCRVRRRRPPPSC